MTTVVVRFVDVFSHCFLLVNNLRKRLEEGVSFKEGLSQLYAQALRIGCHIDFAVPCRFAQNLSVFT